MVVPTLYRRAVLAGLATTALLPHRVQAEEVIGVYSENGFNLVNSDQIVDWTTLTMSKNTPL